MTLSGVTVETGTQDPLSPLPQRHPRRPAQPRAQVRQAVRLTPARGQATRSRRRVSGTRRFPPTSPLDPQSASDVSELQRQIATFGLWMNTTSYSVPVYEVAESQATQHVTLDTWGPDLQAQLTPSRFPPTLSRLPVVMSTWSFGSHRPTRCGSSG